MSNTQKPMALILADKYEVQGFLGDHRFAKDEWCSQAAVELRSLHARYAELEAALLASAGKTQANDSDQLSDFQEGQWWVNELDAMASHPIGQKISITPDLKRSVSVVHNLLCALLAAMEQAQADALDAARYRFLRDTCWSSNKELATVISLQMNKVWDEKIDEAMARNKEE